MNVLISFVRFSMPSTSGSATALPRTHRLGTSVWSNSPRLQLSLRSARFSTIRSSVLRSCQLMTGRSFRQPFNDRRERHDLTDHERNHPLQHVDLHVADLDAQFLPH